MLRFLKKYPIRTQLLLLAVCTGLVMFTIIFLIYSQVSKIVWRYINEYTDNITFQIERTISTNCEQIDRLLSSVAYSRLVQGYISEADPETKYAMFKDMNNYMNNTASMNEGIVDIVVLDKDGNNVFFLHGENKQVEKILTDLPEGINNYYTPVHPITYQNVTRNCFIVASDIRSIVNVNVSGDRLGIAAVVIDADTLSLNVNKELNRSKIQFYLLDRSNKVYSASQSQPQEAGDDTYMKYCDAAPGKYTAKVGGQTYAVSKDDLAGMGGKIISVVPQQELYSDIVMTRSLAISLFVIALALLSIPFMVITNNIVRPLRKFVSFFTSVKEKKLVGLKQRLDAEGYSEMVIMVGEFNSLLDEIDSLTQRLVVSNTRLYQTELEKNKSELAYLKSQINPHFLYNTLEAMKGSAIDEGAEKTQGMAKALAQIFRYSVKGADIVTLSEEVQIIKYYLYIQQVRFRGRFQIFYDFSEESLKCGIPKMILQPIAENAVYHGLETKLGGGCLWFESKIDGSGVLTITVKDDGVGMDGETLEHIRVILRESRGPNRFESGNEAIGLKNVDNRIKLMYGEEYGLAIDSTLGRGTEAVIRIPTGGN